MANDYVESGYIEDGYFVASGTVGDYLFDGTAKRIYLLGLTTLDLIDLHSRWKDWILMGNAECLIAFGAVGGDIPAIPLYLFLQNGWKIVPQAADHVLTVTQGILETSDGSDPFVDPAGTYKIRINRQTPGIAIGYSTSGVAAPTAEQNASAILAAAQVTPIKADAQVDPSSVWTDGRALTVGKFLALKD